MTQPGHIDISSDASRLSGIGKESFRLSRLGFVLGSAQLVQTGIGVTSTAALASISTTALAAGAAVNSVVLLAFQMSFGVLLGFAPVAGAALGAGNVDTVRAAVRGVVVMTIALGLILIVITLTAPIIIAALADDASLYDATKTYSVSLACASLLSIVAAATRMLSSVLNNGKGTFTAAMVGLSTNTVLAFGLAGGRWGLPPLGISGVGLAAVATTAVMTVIVWASLHVRLAELRPVPGVRAAAPAPNLIPAMVRLGLPSGVVLFVEGTCLTASQLIMTHIDLIHAAAQGLMIQIFTVATALAIGIGQAATILIATADGRGSSALSRRLAMRAVELVGVLSLAIGGILFLFPRSVLGLLVGWNGHQSGVVVTLGASLMAAVALAQLLNSLIIVLAGILRGMRNVIPTMMTIVITYWFVGVGLSWFFGIERGYGGLGVWTGLITGFVISLAFLSRQVCLTFGRYRATANGRES
jgi:MATE family multidrug resistance protein